MRPTIVRVFRKASKRRIECDPNSREWEDVYSGNRVLCRGWLEFDLFE